MSPIPTIDSIDNQAFAWDAPVLHQLQQESLTGQVNQRSTGSVCFVPGSLWQLDRLAILQNARFRLRRRRHLTTFAAWLACDHTHQTFLTVRLQTRP